MTQGRFVRRGHERVFSRISMVVLSVAAFLMTPATTVLAASTQISLDFTTGWPVAALLALLVFCIALWSLFRGRSRRRAAMLCNLFEALFENDPEARLITTPKGKHLAASAAWREWVGGAMQSSGDVASSSKNPSHGLQDILFAGDDAASELARLAKVAGGGESCHAELALVDTDRPRQRILAEPLPGHRGWVVWSLPSGQDNAALDEAAPDHAAGNAQVPAPDGETEEQPTAHDIEDRSGDIQDLGEIPLLSLRKNTRIEGADIGTNWENRFRNLFIDSPVGIALIDRDGRISECNGAFGKSLALEPGLAEGKTLQEFVALRDETMKFDDWLDLARQGKTLDLPLVVTLGDNKKEWTLFANSLSEEDGDDGSNLVIYSVEKGGAETLDAKGRQSQKLELVGQLAGGIAHDFNNLLTAMIGFCDLLLLRHTPKDQSFADIMQIKQNANRAANLVRQLLAFSRQQTLQPKRLVLTDVLAELSNLLRRLIGARIELNIIHGRDVGLIKADQGQLEQVVTNLAVNARDAMVDGGILTIETCAIPAGDSRLQEYSDLPDGDYVSINVIDTGSGIPDDVLEKIYEPFFTTKDIGEGTGLGLATVYGIVKQTGGHIFVESTLGEGTKFTILFPAYDSDADEETEEQPAEKAESAPRLDLTGAGTILLVEDEDAVRLFGARALRNKGYTVMEANNGEAGLEVLKTDAASIDLLITDVVMPGVDGPTLVRQVRKDHPDLKVIFISGYTEDTFRSKLDDGEEVHFLPKPFSLKQLAGKVKEVMQDDSA